MKTLVNKLKSSALGILAAVTLFASMAPTPATAQIFSSGVGVIGTSNAVVQVNFQTVTNQAYSSLLPRTLVLQNINTNETVTVAYGYVFSGFGLTNLWYGPTNVFTFPASNGWVNGATFVTNISAVTVAVPVTPVGQLIISGNYSNNVIFQ